MIVSQGYKETSDFASSDENTDTSDSGQNLFGGLEVGVRYIRIGVEAMYRRVPDAFGAGGVSKAMNEKDLGGTVVRLTIGIGF